MPERTTPSSVNPTGQPGTVGGESTGRSPRCRRGVARATGDQRARSTDRPAARDRRRSVRPRGARWQSLARWTELVLRSATRSLTPDDGTILVGLITAVGWVAWAVFAASVISELVALASRPRIQIRLPGLAGPQRLAAGLLISVITMVTAPQLVQAQPRRRRP